MSYSFNVRGATKQEAARKAAAEMAQVVAQQPVHAQDQHSALDTMNQLLNLLQTNENFDVMISMHGSCGYSWAPDTEAMDVPLTQVGLGCNVYHVTKEVLRPDPANGAPMPHGHNPVA